MNSVVFSLESQKVTGIDRAALPFEREIKIPFPINLQKTITIDTGLKKQTVNEHGQLLYATNMFFDEDGDLVSYDETTESRVPIEFETRTEVYRVPTGEVTEGTDPDGNPIEIPVYEEIANPVEVPIRFQELYPIGEPILEAKTLTLEQNYMEFTAEEIVEAKVKGINTNNFRQVCFFSEDLDITEFSLNSATQGASFGSGFISLGGGGYARTTKLSLPKATAEVDLYLEAQEGIIAEIGVTADNFVPVVKGTAVLDTEASEVYVRFTNTKDTKRELYAFGLLV